MKKLINGIYTDMSKKDIAEMQYEEEKNRAEQHVDVLQLIIDSVHIEEKPESEKEGYTWKPIYNNASNCIVWELEKDDTYVKKGTYDTPLWFVENEKNNVQGGMYYINDLGIYACKKTGTATTLNDTDYFIAC